MENEIGSKKKNSTIHTKLLLLSISLFIVSIVSSFYFLWQTCFILNLSNPGFVSFAASIFALILLFSSSLYFFKVNIPLNLQRENSNLKLKNEELEKFKREIQPKVTQNETLRKERDTLEDMYKGTMQQKALSDLSLQRIMTENAEIIKDLGGQIDDLFNKNSKSKQSMIESLNFMKERLDNHYIEIEDLKSKYGPQSCSDHKKSHERKKKSSVFSSKKDTASDQGERKDLEEMRARTNSKILESERESEFRKDCDKLLENTNFMKRKIVKKIGELTDVLIKMSNAEVGSWVNSGQSTISLAEARLVQLDRMFQVAGSSE